jgi:hypothetical protein
VGVVREIEAGLCIAAAPAGVDPERADLPVGRNRPHQEKDQHQAGEEEDEADWPAALPLFLRLLFSAISRRQVWQRLQIDDGRNHGGRDELGLRLGRDCDRGVCLRRRLRADRRRTRIWDGAGYRRRAADRCRARHRRFADDRRWRRFWSRLRWRLHWLRLAASKPGQPVLEQNFVQAGRFVFGRVGTPADQAHLRPPYCRAVTALVSRPPARACHGNGAATSGLQLHHFHQV